MRRKVHNGLMHAILHFEQRNTLRFTGHDLFHQRVRQSTAGRIYAFNGGWQLTMVARQHYPFGFSDGNPASGFQCLSRFVNKQRAEFASAQHTMIGADQR